MRPHPCYDQETPVSFPDYPNDLIDILATSGEEGENPERIRWRRFLALLALARSYAPDPALLEPPPPDELDFLRNVRKDLANLERLIRSGHRD